MPEEEMSEKTPTIEEQINTTISKAMEIAHKEQKITIEETIEKKVNGKLDKLQLHMNDQDIKLEGLGKSADEIKHEQTRVKDELKKLQVSTDPLVNVWSVLTSLGKFIMWFGGIALILSALYKLIWHK